MRVRGLHVLRCLHEQGGVTWDRGRPEVPSPANPEAAQMLWEDRQTIQAVLRRAAAFHQQLSVPSVDPFLRFRDAKWTAEGCPSCGTKVAEHEFLRCDLCALGVELALVAPAEVRQPAQEGR